jgi:hypothetical protein
MTSQGRFLLEKPALVQVVKKLSVLIESKGPLLFSQEPTTGLFLDPDESSPQSHNLFKMLF